MNAGKLFTQPIFLLLTSGILWIVFALFRRPAWRPALRVPAALLGLLWISALPATGDLLQRSLEVPTAPAGFAPEVIDVPGGGYAYRGADMTVLSPDSILRVLAAVRWWRENPTAKVVMSGGSEDIGMPGLEMSVAMADLAVAQGIPRNQVFFETRSLNTRQHPVELLKFPFVTPATRIGVATSSWHLRRTLHVFRRRFASAEGIPAHAETPSARHPQFWVPSADGLLSTTRMLQEWIGLAWYMARETAEGPRRISR